MPVPRCSTMRAILHVVTFVLCAALPASSAEPESGTEMFTLANGMRWIASPMEAAGEVTVVFYVATGTAHETTTSRGAVASLVELWRLGTADALAARGVAPTAFFANPDFALARATWPSARLAEAVAFAAAHWLKPETVRFAEARTKAVAARDRALQGPFRLHWQMCRTAYTVHPYGRPYFGEKGDLERLGEPAFREHLAAHLVPANLVAVVTGDFDRAVLRAAAEREFGSQPALAAPVAVQVAEPPQREEKRVVLADAAVGGLAIGFHKHIGASAGMAAWGVLLEVWKRRLDQRTAHQRNLVRRFDAGQAPAMKHPNLLFALWETEPAADLRAIETAAIEEWERLGVEPLRPAELEEVKRQLVGEPRKLDARTHGQHLADWLVMTGDYRPAFTHALRVRAVTAEQVLALARDVLRPGNRTVVTSAVSAAGGR